MPRDIFKAIDQIKNSLFNSDNMELFFHESGKKVEINELNKNNCPDGMLFDCKIGNIIYPMVFYNGDLCRIEIEQTLNISIEKFIHDDNKEPEWKKVGEGNPYDLILSGVLNEHDVIRFVNEKGEFIPWIPELELADISGVFFIARSLDDLEESMYEIFQNAIEDDDDECEEREGNPFDYERGDLSIIPASPLLEYLRSYGITLREANRAVEMMETEMDKLTK